MVVYVDTETCGLCGPPVIIQYTYDDGPIHIHNFWTQPTTSSLKLIEELCKHKVVGFNLAFDWFQLNKIYNLFSTFGECIPEEYISEIAEIEDQARFGYCIKPEDCVDLMLVARKTKYQITMNRSDIRLKRVPTVLADKLRSYLEDEIILQDILFARRKDKYAPKWKLFPCQKRQGGKMVDDPDFRDIVLKFKPSTALKALAIDALKVDPSTLLVFSDIEIDSRWHPNEIPYAPFAKAVRDYPLTQKNRTSKEAKRIWKYRKFPWKWAWPDVIDQHIHHWETNGPAREYAAKDILYTRGLYEHFGNPDSTDDDILSCMVGAVRWRGYSVNLDGLARLKEDAQRKAASAPKSPRQVKAILSKHLSAEEMSVLDRGTGKLILQELASWKNKPCPMCEMMGPTQDCDVCAGTNKYTHPISKAAQNILDARLAGKEIELYNKLLLAGRFHASFRVIGTLSSRMSGSDGLNAQGIKRDKFVRQNFTFSNGDDCLVGGDFDGFEVVIADAAYNDPDLRAALLKKAICPGCLGAGTKKGLVCKDCKGEGQTGQKIHGLFAMELFPGVTYEEVVNSKGSSHDMYDYGKRGVFSQIYGGNENTLVNKLGVSLEVATRASRGFLSRYKQMGLERAKIFDMFCSMRQPQGIGTRVEWHEPADYVESLLGFRRYFTLENKICKSLFTLANKLPKDWISKVKVVRRDREQTASGALCSALYSAAFQLQAANMRAAANHVIQSTGAQITKHVQRKIWDLQPVGISKWFVQPCNIHDEILVVCDKTIKDKVQETVYNAVESFRNKVPLIKMEWHDMTTWADK